MKKIIIASLFISVLSLSSCNVGDETNELLDKEITSTCVENDSCVTACDDTTKVDTVRIK
jgi:hypothetical protein